MKEKDNEEYSKILQNLQSISPCCFILHEYDVVFFKKEQSENRKELLKIKNSINFLKVKENLGGYNSGYCPENRISKQSKATGREKILKSDHQSRRATSK